MAKNAQKKVKEAVSIIEGMCRVLNSFPTYIGDLLGNKLYLRVVTFLAENSSNRLWKGELEELREWMEDVQA